MNRRLLIKGLLGAYITNQMIPDFVFAQPSQKNIRIVYSDVESCIDKGVVGWDFGKGMHNFQYHAFDVENSYLYTLQHSTNNNNGGKVSRFNMNNIGRKQVAVDAQSYDLNIGHQMLSVEHYGTEVKLWAAKGLQESYSLIRFDYTPDGLASNIEEYVMFDPQKFGSFYITGNLSVDEKWVIVRGKRPKNSINDGMNCIAIFSLKKLVNNGPGNVWHLAEHIWDYDFYQNNPINTDINPQSVFSDGKYIFMLFGPLDINKPNLLRAYTFDGNLIFESSELKLGKKQAFNSSLGQANELEGAQLVQLTPDSKVSLTIGFVRGGPVYYKGIYLITDFPLFK